MARQIPDSTQPNIIVLNCDDAPLNLYASMPLFAANWDSQFLDYTTNGSCNGPLCGPGRAATLTGLAMEHHQVFDNSSGAAMDATSTFLVAAENAGYHTGAFGKWMNAFGETFGAEEKLPGCTKHAVIFGNPNYFDYYLLDETGALTHYGDRASEGGSDANYATDVELANILAFISAAPSNKPFCIYWGAKCPHKDSGSGPTPAPRHDASTVNLIPDVSFGVNPRSGGNPQWMTDAAETPWDDAAIAAVVAEHKLALQALLSLDEAVHAILTALQAAGKLANTYFFFKTDNAHTYGNLRQNDKGTPHRGSSSMLLKVRLPSGVGGVRDQAVSDIDIAPTIAHLTGGVLPWAPDGMSMYSTFASNDVRFRAAAPLYNPYKNSPTFQGLWTENGKVWHEGIVGGDAAGQFGCWEDYDHLVNTGWNQQLHDDMVRLRAASYRMP